MYVFSLNQLLSLVTTLNVNMFECMYLRMQYGPEVFFKHGYCEMQHTAKKWTRTFMFLKSKSKYWLASVSYCCMVSDEIQKMYKLYAQ